MLAAGADHLFELFTNTFDARVDHAPVRLDLRLAGAADKAQPPALAFEVGPGSDEAALGVGQMREFDLKRALARLRPFAEDFEDQPGAIQHLGLPRGFKIALLHRG